MSIIKNHRNGVAKDVNVASMLTDVPAVQPSPPPPAQLPEPVTPATLAPEGSGFTFETTRLFFERHKVAVQQQATIRSALTPIVERLMEEYPDAHPVLAEVLEGLQQKVRQAHEAKRHQERRRHGGR